MPELSEIVRYASIVGAFVLMIFVVRTRRRQHRAYMEEVADREVCEHLQPVLDELRRRGHVVRKVGMHAEDAPLEIFVNPRFDPAQLAEEIKLQPPALLSDRGVIYCPECGCEISGVSW